MRRREFIAGMAGSVAAWPFAANAQRPDKMFRLGQLSGGTAVSREPLIASFMKGMRDLGYVEGQNLVVQHKFAEGHFDRLPTLVRELLEWKPDVLFVSTTPASLAAKAATSTVPIVMVSVADPLGVGLIANLARPGGNITGVTNIGAELAGKRLEILRELVPTAAKIAVLINPDDSNAPLQMKSAKSVADKLAVQLAPVLPIRGGADLQGAFEAAIGSGAGAAMRMIDPLTTALQKQTVALAAQFRLPVIYPFRENVHAGGLICYGTNLHVQYQQAATFVHKIFNGAKPADLPVEQPTTFDLAINLKTARALDLKVPPTLLARANEVIE